MVAMFREHYVVPLRQKGEDEAAARLPAKETVKDTGMRLRLQMFNPGKTPPEWKKRT